MPRPGSIALAVFIVRVALVALALDTPRAAHANGAFPESFQLLLPSDRPHEIVLATNFGLMISDDDGATWTWTCEQPETLSGYLYAVSAMPLDRFFSLSPSAGLAYSDDTSCSWRSATGSVDPVVTTDYFPDPTNPLHVLALGESLDGSAPPQVLPSDDGAATFKDAIFTGPLGATFAGVESARSDPQTIYVAMYTSLPAPGIYPKLARSTDGGAHWATVDEQPFLGQNNFRIIAIDPLDARVLTVRVIEHDGDSAWISRDGGDSFVKVFKLAGGSLTAYARLDSGTVLVGGVIVDKAHGFRSMDGGMTFQDWAPTTVGSLASDGGVPHLRALAARGGKVFAAAKNYSDDWAVGVSTDEGLTFQPLTRYDQVTAIRACVQLACFDDCGKQVSLQVWPKAICGSTTALPEPPPPTKTGCGCRLGGATTGAGGALALATICVAARARRRRR
jgi:hypothetical protein